MLQTATGNFVIVGANNPKLYWKGQELTEVTRVLFQSSGDLASVKLKALNTTNFDVVYAEMELAGIDIKK